MLNEIEDVGHFWGEDDFGAAVESLVGWGVVGYLGSEFGMTAGFDTSGVDLLAVLQEELDNRCCSHDAEVPVVFDGGAAFEGGVVGMSFNHDVEVGVFFKHFGERFKGFDALFGYCPTC